MEKETECPYIKVADDIKTGALSIHLEPQLLFRGTWMGCRNGLERKFSKNECKFWYARWTNPVYWCRLVMNWLGSNATENDLGVLENNSLYLS